MCIGGEFVYWSDTENSETDSKETSGDLDIIGVGLSLRNNNKALLEVWVKKVTKDTHKKLSDRIHNLLEIDRNVEWKTLFKLHTDALNVCL